MVSEGFQRGLKLSVVSEGFQRAVVSESGFLEGFQRGLKPSVVSDGFQSGMNCRWFQRVQKKGDLGVWQVRTGMKKIVA